MYFYKNDFGVKLPTKVDVPLNKETKPNKTKQKCKYEHTMNMIP